MSQSELINELAAALAKAQGEMQAAIKDKVNPFYKSSYADLGSVWDAARPVLSKNGLCVMQTTRIEGNQIILVTKLAHCSGQWVNSELPLILSKHDSQGIGAAMTYLRRYSLCALVSIVYDNDDDGETAVGRGKTNYKKKEVQENQEPQEVERINSNEIASILNLLNQLDDEAKKGFFAWVKTAFNADTVEDLPKEKYQTCMTSLNAKIKYLRSQEKVA